MKPVKGKTRRRKKTIQCAKPVKPVKGKTSKEENQYNKNPVEGETNKGKNPQKEKPIRGIPVKRNYRKGRNKLSKNQYRGKIV